ncbi:hypothetical protein VKT23_014031 [Stygiomarasmius scandens]|uniref:Uncharacterized protein n=1 Tax=Marasmiellus scandens TaxID=2682957 RepID=A0ABR1J6G2_9AGAR
MPNLSSSLVLKRGQNRDLEPAAASETKSKSMHEREHEDPDSDSAQVHKVPAQKATTSYIAVKNQSSPAAAVAAALNFANGYSDGEDEEMEMEGDGGR